MVRKQAVLTRGSYVTTLRRDDITSPMSEEKARFWLEENGYEIRSSSCSATRDMLFFQEVWEQKEDSNGKL